MKIYEKYKVFLPKAKQPDYGQWKFSGKPRTKLNGILWDRNYRDDTGIIHPVKLFNDYLYDKSIAELRRRSNRNLERSEDPQIWTRERPKVIDWMEDNREICIRGLNRMLVNHLIKHKLLDYDIQEETTDYLNSLDYKDYLKSSHRQKIRIESLIRHSHKCIVCDNSQILNVHHKTYKNKGTEKEIDDLIVLCRDCHSKFHNKVK